MENITGVAHVCLGHLSDILKRDNHRSPPRLVSEDCRQEQEEKKGNKTNLCSGQINGPHILIQGGLDSEGPNQLSSYPSHLPNSR